MYIVWIGTLDSVMNENIHTKICDKCHIDV